MNEAFYWCVHFLERMAMITGMSYEEINIWLFVIIHPAITLILFMVIIYLIIKLRKAKRINRSALSAWIESS
ncbi:MAG: hypothetical protein LH473_03730 [Chitinophagales bacterium]|nr:hypothetical protein [Chitinophagales bacterium]